MATGHFTVPIAAVVTYTRSSQLTGLDWEVGGQWRRHKGIKVRRGNVKGCLNNGRGELEMDMVNVYMYELSLNKLKIFKRVEVTDSNLLSLFIPTDVYLALVRTNADLTFI